MYSAGLLQARDELAMLLALLGAGARGLYCKQEVARKLRDLAVTLEDPAAPAEYRSKVAMLLARVATWPESPRRGEERGTRLVPREVVRLHLKENGEGMLGGRGV